MDQKKIGQFLKGLHRERALTQGQLAEILGVSDRSISRWENGVTMPDLNLLIEIAAYYDVEIGEILDGERKGETMDKMKKREEETLRKVADYSNAEKDQFSKRICWLFIAGLAALGIYMAIDIQGLTRTEGYEGVASFMMGIVCGDLLVGALYTSRYMAKIRAAKMRLLGRIRGADKRTGEGHLP